MRIIVVLATIVCALAVATTATPAPQMSTQGAHWNAPFRRPSAMAWEIRRFDTDAWRVHCVGAGQARQGRFQHFWCDVYGFRGQYWYCYVHLTGWKYGQFKYGRCY